MKIAFDLDGVIIGKPPLIPKKILERLYAGGQDSLHCRFPSSQLSQKIRQLSHFYLLRPPIGENIEFLKKAAKRPGVVLYVISSRYSFLADQTQTWLEKRKINHLFREVHLNLNNEPPHLFKARMLREIKPAIYIDDDKNILGFLKAKFPEIVFYCPENNRYRYLEELLKLEESVG